MTTQMNGYDFKVTGPVVDIKPGHMVEFRPASSLLQPESPHRSGKKAFEEAFDTLATQIVESLCEGEIQLRVTGIDPVWQVYFRDAIVRALSNRNLEQPRVSIV